MDYQTFLARKAQSADGNGFAPLAMPDALFDFQRHLVDWSLRQGRSAIFADCGLGKTAMQLTWADNIVRHTNRPVLVLTPLAVAQQTIHEGEKFGIWCARSAGEVPTAASVVVTNYEKLHRFNPGDFAGVVCDESSILKSFDGVRRAAVTEFMRTVPYRLLCTATAAPNDYIELGTSSEALGGLGHTDMLGRFFRNDQNRVKPVRRWTANQTVLGDSQSAGGDRGAWRFKGHAEQPFWRWVCSWARACRKPSDLGFEDDGFVLPPLHEREHLTAALSLPEGMLFNAPARNMREEREERRRTLRERCEMVAQLVADSGRPAVIWCHLNQEGDLLESLIPGAVQICGADSEDKKEEAYRAFGSGEVRVLVTKPKIGAWGLNWQHCAHVVTFASHSYEQYYQAVRRCWRFGQTCPVVVDLVLTEGEQRIKESIRRKAAAADRMFSALVAHMNEAMRIDGGNRFTTPEEVPAWL